MALVSDLLDVKDEPSTMEEWLGRFSEQDRKIVIDSIRSHKSSKIYPILKDLDENPYPFSVAALSDWRRRTYG